MLNVCVCDDNQKTAQGIETIIDKFCKKRKIEVLIKVYYDGEDLINDGNIFDIMFLDVEMPKMDGNHTAKLIRKYDTNTKIIYITSYAHYRRNAFIVHAFDYLRKPFATERVEQVMEEVLEYMDKETKNSTISVIANGEPFTFQTREIYYFERSQRKVKIISTREEITIANRLEDILEKIRDKGFESCHKSYLVNLFYIKKITGFQIELKNGDSIPLAQKRAVEFKKKFNDYLHESYDII